jgi:hypothetical protein
VLALVGALGSMLLIRNRDFVSRQPAPTGDHDQGMMRPEPRPA